jgi:hypothetical protein
MQAHTLVMTHHSEPEGRRYANGAFNGTGVTKENKSARHSVMAHFME